MTKSEMFKKAHANARQTKKYNPWVNYRVQFSFELRRLMNRIEDYPETKLAYDSKLQELIERKERQIAMIHNAKLDGKVATVKIIEKILAKVEADLAKIS